MARTKVDRNPFLDPEAPTLATVLAALESAEPDRAPARRDGVGDPDGLQPCSGTARTSCRPTRRCSAG